MLAPLTLATRVPSARPVLSMGHTLVDVLAVTLDLNVITISTNATKVRHTSSIVRQTLNALIFFYFINPGSPCEHGGTCVNIAGSYRCDCPSGFKGRRCEMNINECESNPCQNEGTCIDERGGFRCICMPGKLE